MRFILLSYGGYPLSFLCSFMYVYLLFSWPIWILNLVINGDGLSIGGAAMLGFCVENGVTAAALLLLLWYELIGYLLMLLRLASSLRYLPGETL